MAKKTGPKRKPAGIKVSKVKIDDKGMVELDDAALKGVAGGLTRTLTGEVNDPNCTIPPLNGNCGNPVTCSNRRCV